MSDVASPTKPSIGTGVRSLFRGIAFVMSTPKTWGLALVPLLLGLLLTVVLGYAATQYVPGWIGGLVGPTSGTLAAIGSGFLKVIGTLLALVVAVMLAFIVAQPISGPALERIVRAQEAELGFPPRPPTPLWLDVLRSLGSLLTGLAIGLPALAVLFLLSFVVPGAAVVLFPLQVSVAAFTISWDLCDYPLALRGLPLRDRLAMIWRNRGAVFGFSLPLALAGLLPCMLFILLPFAVAGATQLMCEVEQHESPA